MMKLSPWDQQAPEESVWPLADYACRLHIALQACLPHLGEAFRQVESPFKHGVGRSWIGFTEIVLALSGV